ncbi:MAG: SEC-C domain-containing protein [Gammaproteobacteria bacterium]|nr:SEC-C domain-containing protein [Gammaproteobacteria bacterium]
MMTVTSTPSREAPCPCGSGKRYESCCLGKDNAGRGASRWGATAQAYQAGQYKHTVGAGKVAPAAAPRLVAQPQSGNAESHYAQGNKLLIAGKLEEAVVSYRRAIGAAGRGHSDVPQGACDQAELCRGI